MLRSSHSSGHRAARALLASLLAAAGCAAPSSAPRLAAEVDSILFVRVGCYRDDCPAYRLLLRRDGTADWHGAELAVPAGGARGRVPAAAWRALAATVVTAGLDTLDDVYPSPELASSRAEIRVYAGRGPVRVVATSGGAGPPILESLFARIDSVAASLGWRGETPFRPTTGGIRPF
jgi:hypothetical protein